LLERVKVKLSLQAPERDRSAWHFLGLHATVKLEQFVISEPDKVHHQSRVALQQLTPPVETS